MTVESDKLFVVYMDSHFVLMAAENEEDARRLKGVILGHYLSTEQAQEARATIRTIIALGYGHTLKPKEFPPPASPDS